MTQVARSVIWGKIGALWWGGGYTMANQEGPYENRRVRSPRRRSEKDPANQQIQTNLKEKGLGQKAGPVKRGDRSSRVQ